MSHAYVSTACLHEADDPDMHDSCRKTCKFCDAPCQCPGHVAGEVPRVESWVEQARGIARELLHRPRWPGDPSYEGMINRILTDPALFWLRKDGTYWGIGGSSAIQRRTDESALDT